MTEFIADFFASLDQLAFGWLISAVFIFTSLEASLLIGLIVSGEMVILAAGAATNTLQETALVIIAASIGAVLGQSGGYLIGAKLGERIRASFLRKWLTDRHWQQAEEVLNRGIGPGVIVAHYVPILHATLPVAAGMTKIPYRRFAPWAAAASTLWAIIYISAGAIFGQVARAHPERIGWLALLAFGIGASLWFLGYSAHKLVRRMRVRRSEQQGRSKNATPL